MRATLLTGLPPRQHGLISNQYRLPQVQKPDGFGDLPTLPGLLQKAGYRTVLVGKWHVDPDPWNCGFSDIRVWMPGGSGPYQDAKLAQGKSRVTKEVKGYTNQVFADDAVAFLNSDAAHAKP